MNILYFDIESHSADLKWSMPPDEFFRLGQYAWNDGEVVLTTDRQEMLDQFEQADLIVGHNIHNFDLGALYGPDSIRPLELALEGRVVDTMVMANLVVPPRYMFRMRPRLNAKGEETQRVVTDGQSPEKAKIWLSLDNLCFQLGIDGKFGDVKSMAQAAAKANGLSATDPRGFGLIDVNDPDFREYARQDVIALRDLYEVLRSLVRRSGFSQDYLDYAQELAACDAQMTRNGVPVNVEYCEAEINRLAQQRDELLTTLQAEYDFPMEGKSPWASAAGKEAIIRILADYGITEETHPEWPRTPKGALKLGGDELKALTKGTEAESLGVALAALKGQRSTAQEILSYMQPDGRVHPDITRFQRSGRTSITKPALGIVGARGAKAQVKQAICALPGHVIVSADLSNADSRIVAAYSGDRAYAKRLEPGADGHEITARLMYGDEEYEAQMPEGWETDSEIRKKNPLRNTSKALSHAYAYRAGTKTLARTAGVEEEVAQKFVNAMEDAYPGVSAWQDDVTDEGRSGRVKDAFGRVYQIDKDRAYTQAPAMFGQGGTAEILGRGIVRIAKDDPNHLRWIWLSLHDELLLHLPEGEEWWFVPFVEDMVGVNFHPRGGQEIHFPLAAGAGAKDWYGAGH